jgi:hypothetical protein
VAILERGNAIQTLEDAMTAKERLHHLVEVLPESEAPTATRILEALVATADPVLRAHLLAPEDDKGSELDDRDGGLAEARAEVSLSHEEARRRLYGMA